MAGANVQFASTTPISKDLDFVKKCLAAGTELHEMVGGILIVFHPENDEVVAPKAKIWATFTWRGRLFTCVFRRFGRPNLLSVTFDPYDGRVGAMETEDLIKRLKRSLDVLLQKDHPGCDGTVV